MNEPVPRSWLFVPGNREDLFAKAANSGADALILDLEDAVADGDKDMARGKVLDFLSQPGRPPTPVAVRINALSTLEGMRDVVALTSAGPDFLVLPKSESGDVLNLIAAMLERSDKAIRLLALVETALGVANAVKLASSTPRLTGLLFGAADYAGNLGLELGVSDLAYARSAIVNAAASAGICAIDSPFFELENREGLQSECQQARATGFWGKLAIHPDQIPCINVCFTPSAGELSRAHAIVEAEVNGVARIEGKMVDVAIVKWAKCLISSVQSPADDD